MFSSAMNDGATQVLLEIDEVGPMGTQDIAFERSHYISFKKDGTVFNEGKYVLDTVSRYVLINYSVQFVS